jgi:hypothetical protein
VSALAGRVPGMWVSTTDLERLDAVVNHGNRLVDDIETYVYEHQYDVGWRGEVLEEMIDDACTCVDIASILQRVTRPA